MCIIAYYGKDVKRWGNGIWLKLSRFCRIIPSINSI